MQNIDMILALFFFKPIVVAHVTLHDQTIKIQKFYIQVDKEDLDSFSKKKKKNEEEEEEDLDE